MQHCYMKRLRGRNGIDKKERVKTYFQKGLYGKEHLSEFVKVGFLSPEEYQSWTGETWKGDEA